MRLSQLLMMLVSCVTISMVQGCRSDRRLSQTRCLILGPSLSKLPSMSNNRGLETMARAIINR